jgi:hypothetical protein
MIMVGWWPFLVSPSRPGRLRRPAGGDGVHAVRAGVVLRAARVRGPDGAVHGGVLLHGRRGGGGAGGERDGRVVPGGDVLHGGVLVAAGVPGGDVQLQDRGGGAGAVRAVHGGAVLPHQRADAGVAGVHGGVLLPDGHVDAAAAMSVRVCLSSPFSFFVLEGGGSTML